MPAHFHDPSKVDDFLRADLDEAWTRVGEIEGPELGDASAKLYDRNVTFHARLTAFRSVWTERQVSDGDDPVLQG